LSGLAASGGGLLGFFFLTDHEGDVRFDVDGEEPLRPTAQASTFQGGELALFRKQRGTSYLSHCPGSNYRPCRDERLGRLLGFAQFANGLVFFSRDSSPLGSVADGLQLPFVQLGSGQTFFQRDGPAKDDSESASPRLELGLRDAGLLTIIDDPSYPGAELFDVLDPEEAPTTLE
jgi:hypothetical protein